MIIYQEFLAINEELPAFDPAERLRYAVHEIMIRMKDGQEIKFGALSKVLKEEFKIDITESLLKKIFEDWDRYQNPDYSFFKKEDKNWMDAWPTMGYLKRKCRDKQSFGKHRKKEIRYTGGYYQNGRWVPDRTAGNTWTGRNPYGEGWYD